MEEPYTRVSRIILTGVLESIEKVVALLLRQGISAISWYTMKILD